MNESALTVRYGVTRTNGWAAWVIRAATRSPYNHAFILNGDGLTIEAAPHGLQYGRQSRYPEAVLSDPIDGPQAHQVWNWSVAHLGTPYGWPDIVAIALLCLHVPTPRWALRRLSTTKTLICSQAVATAYASACLRLGDKAPAFTTPGDLGDVLAGEPEPADR